MTEIDPIVPMVVDQATLDEGPAVLRWPKDLSTESVKEFEYWINGLIRRIRRKAAAREPCVMPEITPPETEVK